MNYQNYFSQFEKNVVWNETIFKKILVAYLSWGHILLESLPGFWKTLIAKTFCEILGLQFSRVQCTPDLLPSDIIWTQVYNQFDWSFGIKKWPIFTNLLLVDEINRAPAKVQSALLEAMAEKQVTIGWETFFLPENFFVIATQNPIENAGTYELPEAQLDRFLMKLVLDYPTKDEEILIMKDQKTENISPIKLWNISSENIKVSYNIYDYILRLANKTRKDSDIQYWVSPRWTKALLQCAKTLAFIEGYEFVTPDHIQSLVKDVRRHRVVLQYWENNADKILDKIISETELLTNWQIK